MRDGSWRVTTSATEVRELFAARSQSDWYAARLEAQQRRDICWEKRADYLALLSRRYETSPCVWRAGG
jgi:hypothetical protein